MLYSLISPTLTPFRQARCELFFDIALQLYVQKGGIYSVLTITELKEQSSLFPKSSADS